MAFGDAKEQVRQAIDIVDLVGSYLELRRQGRNYAARCPWHDDTRPSLSVNPDRQSWKCWVCNLGGDIFSFVMKKESVDFKEALKLLAGCGTTLAGRLLLLDGLNMEWRSMRLGRDPDCAVCGVRA